MRQFTSAPAHDRQPAIQLAEETSIKCPARFFCREERVAMTSCSVRLASKSTIASRAFLIHVTLTLGYFEWFLAVHYMLFVMMMWVRLSCAFVR